MCSTSKLINFSSFYLFQAEESLSETYKDKEYTGIAGLPEFTKVSADLAYGANNPIIKDKRVNYNEFLYLFIFVCIFIFSLQSVKVFLVLELYVLVVNFWLVSIPDLVKFYFPHPRGETMDQFSRILASKPAHIATSIPAPMA